MTLNTVQEYARICKNMQEYARVCKNMQEYARNLQEY